MNTSPLFFLLDGHAISYRAYFGMMKQGRRFQTRSGIPTGAIFGFTRILFELIRSYQPHMMAACFDRPDPTHRHAEYAEYKEHRQPPPDDLILQFPYIERLVSALGIPVFAQGGYEADDMIGTLAQQAAAKGYQVRIITGDRDLFQLVTPLIQVLLPGKNPGEFREYNAERIVQDYGYSPEQVVDFKALAGDTSDNIPGVRGIGEKSALKLLEAFGNLTEIYAQLDKVESKWQSKLREGKELAFMSQKLAQIDVSAPVQFDNLACELAQPDQNDLINLLQELEFNSVIQELPQIFRYFKDSDEVIESVAVNRAKLEPEVFLPATLEEVSELATQLQTAPFAFDTETTGLDSLNTKLVGISFAQGEKPLENGRAWYLNVGHALTLDNPPCLPIEETLAILKPVFEHSKIVKLAHNAKFDLNVLSQYGIQVKGPLDDTMVMDYVLQPDSRHGLKDMSQTYLNLEMQPIDELIGKGRKQITMEQVPVLDAARYAGADAVACLAIRELLVPLLETSGQAKLYQNFDAPLVTVLAEMEQTGICLDTEFLSQLSQQLDQQLRSLETDIFAQAGESFNLNSPRQLSVILFEKLELPTKGLKKNKTGAYSTDVSTLEKLQSVHPMIEKILEYRQLIKLKSTYVDALPVLVNPRTGRLHTTFNQAIVATGRLSSTEPNLQNIPIRTEIGREIRKAFIAAPQHCLVSCDYSQIELRLLAHYSEDPRFMEAFHADRDIHSQTAMDIFGLESLENVTAEMRRIAKTTNFGIVYGQTAFGLANTLNIPNREASKIIERFKERYTGIEAYMQKTLTFAREHGYVETLFGRKRNLTDIHNPNRNLREFAERIAVNSPLQGTASDLIKLAMIRIQAWLKENQHPVKMLLQVHDELLFEMPLDVYDSVMPEIRTFMEGVYSLRVPLRVDIHKGANWKETK
jgi:DNA polymerase I